MFSKISGYQNIEEVNLDQLSQHLSNKGYNFFRHKYRQLESGLSTSSFTIQKNNCSMIVFVMKLGSNSYVSAGYSKGKLVIEKQFKKQHEMPNVVEHMFINIKSNGQNQSIPFDVALGNLNRAAVKLQKNSNNQLVFLQEVKVTPEYLFLKRLEKSVYENIIKTSDQLISGKEALKQKNKNLLQIILQIEGKKQTLQNVMIDFQDEKQYLSNIEARFDELIEIKRKQTEEIQLFTLNETTFDEFTKNLIQLKELEIKKKHLIK